jgi:hypothetical protein
MFHILLKLFYSEIGHGPNLVQRVLCRVYPTPLGSVIDECEEISLQRNRENFGEIACNSIT